jgi:signal transduction histidine kinase
MTHRGSVWRRLVGRRPIVTRLVMAVAATMAVVLLAAGGFVFWRVEFALDRQLNQDLDAYQEVVEAAVARGGSPPADTPGQTFQVYDSKGRVVGGNADARRLVDVATVSTAASGAEVRQDVGHFFPPVEHPYRVVTAQVQSPRGPVVVASAISKNKHDEALRELLLQLLIADLATLAAASVVGYGVARAALNPVERYRRAAEEAEDSPVLPVDVGRDDEVSRLGHTLNALLDRVARANERERRFLADAAHELRSPLALMRTELEVAQLGRHDEATQTALRSLREQVERLIALSTMLLDLEEVRGGAPGPLETEAVDDLLADVVARYAPQAAAAGRRIVIAGDRGLWVRSRGHWLDVAVGNLVSNALRHGDGTVTVSADATEGEVRVSVSDEGPGMPPEFVDVAFDRFSRADTSRAGEGSGLGLALVRAVAESHGGTATVTGPATVSLTVPPSDPAG